MIRRFLAALALAFGAADGAAAAEASFRDWWAGCDERRSCWAFGFPQAEAVGGAFLRIERTGQPTAEPVVLLAVQQEGSGRAPLRVRVAFDDGPELRLDLPARAADDSPHRIAEVREPAAARALVAALQRGRTLKLRVGSGEEAQVSLNGATAALLWLDDQQKRVGTTTALARPGPRAASSIPPAPPRAVVRAAPAASQAGLPTRFPQFVAAQPEVRACLGELFSDFAREPLIARLDARTVLYGVPCGEGAYNLGRRFYLGDASGAGWRRAEFDDAGARGPYGSEGLVNADYDAATGILSAFNKGRGVGDCGEITKWAWDGRRFVLTELTTMPKCGGVPWDLWPTLRDAEVRR
jgi:hypothetical protein